MTNKDIKLKGLFIDDERLPQDVTWIKYPDIIEWTIVRSFQDFSLELAHGDNDYHVYSFDHDIQSYIDGREYTGYDCLKCLLSIETMIGNRLGNTQFFFHTQNVVGKKNMESYYQNYIKITVDKYSDVDYISNKTLDNVANQMGDIK